MATSDTLEGMMKKEQYFDDLMHEVVTLQISDLHFDIRESSSLLFRRHKVNVKQIRDHNLATCYEYLRFKAGFDLSKGTLPQTGSFTYMIDDKEYHLRFSSLETHNRKHGVLRILNMNHIDTLEQSVVKKMTYNFIKKAISKRHGIILFAGMTGSGKTTTMFNALKTLKGRQIFTLENPVETIHEFCVQMELNDHQDITFETGLNQLLRHDPDVIVMGEIRSEEDIKQCIRCGLSGHLVVSTIHSSSIEATLHRLLDLGVSTYDLKMCLDSIIYQEMEMKQDEVHVVYQTANHKTITELLETTIP